jgi:hypothetical protein
MDAEQLFRHNTSCKDLSSLTQADIPRAPEDHHPEQHNTSSQAI